MTEFAIQRQRGGMEPEAVPAFRATAPDEILATFDAVDWVIELAAAHDAGTGDPTFAIEQSDANKQLWLSARTLPADAVSVTLHCAYSYPVRKRYLFGIIAWDAYETPTMRDLGLDEARRVIGSFLAERHDELLGFAVPR